MKTMKLSMLVAMFAIATGMWAAPTTAAPVPIVPADQVIAVFSDSYTISPAWGYLEGWGQTTTLTEANIDGNKYLSYANFNYLG